MDWLEQLEELKVNMKDNPEKWEESTFTKNDIISTLEAINPEITKNSIAFKESNKYIFKQPVSYESSEKIIKFVSNNKKIEQWQINSYKQQLHNICSLIVAKGESPVEMLVYSTKAVQNNSENINLIMDELKEMWIVDPKLTAAYKNILRSWNWPEQLQIVLNSIVSMNLDGFDEELINLFENNVQLREEAAYVIIALKYEKYYNRIINCLLALNIDSREITGTILRILKKMAGASKYGAELVFKTYIETTRHPSLNNVFIAAIKKNATAEIYDKLEKYVVSANMNIQKKAIFLLGKIDNQKSADILKSIKDNRNVNKEVLTIAFGNSKNKDYIDLLKNIADDNERRIQERTAALISLANVGGTELIPYVENYINKSPEFEIAAASVLVQFGKMEKITVIFRYILTKNIAEAYVKEAVRQINRLRSLKNPEINSSLNKALKNLLKGDNEFVVLSLVNLFTKGIPDDDVADTLLYKLKNTTVEQAKLIILKYLAKNYPLLSEKIQDMISKEIVTCSLNNSSDQIKNTAMECLSVITRKADLRPVANASIESI